MSRSIKKGPFVHESLMKKIKTMNEKSDKKVVKTMLKAIFKTLLLICN